MSKTENLAQHLEKLQINNMYKNDFYWTWDKTDDELDAIFTVADALRDLRERNISTKIFDSGLGISIFRDNSTRTRFSFASACNLLGLDIKDLDEKTSQIAHGETVRETANMETAAHVQALIDAHHALWGEKRIGHKDADPKLDAMHLRERPLTDKWTFSTNGVSIQGRYGIPCVGFGPGAESQAHAPNEITWKQDLVTCAALYAAVPGLYKEENKSADVTQFRQSLTDNEIQ